MIPSAIVEIEFIPVTPNGKVDRNSLPDPFKKAAYSAYEIPKPGVESQIAEVWKRIIKIDRVGAGDNFFELGGHSLLALKFTFALEKEFGLRMDPRALFFQNLREIALSMRRGDQPIERKELDPIFFGASPRRLFGVYDPADGNSSKGLRAAVLCNPWGPEYIYAHRALRQLAKRLSLAGCHTLRFDYFGTGISAGDMVDAELAGWKGDIETAIDEVMDLTGAKRVALLGLRLGATLAASVAATRQKGVDALILWDPIVDGTTYLDSLGVMSSGDQNWDNLDRLPGR